MRVLEGRGQRATDDGGRLRWLGVCANNNQHRRFIARVYLSRFPLISASTTTSEYLSLLSCIFLACFSYQHQQQHRRFIALVYLPRFPLISTTTSEYLSYQQQQHRRFIALVYLSRLPLNNIGVYLIALVYLPRFPLVSTSTSTSEYLSLLSCIFLACFSYQHQQQHQHRSISRCSCPCPPSTTAVSARVVDTWLMRTSTVCSWMTTRPSLEPTHLSPPSKQAS